MSTPRATGVLDKGLHVNLSCPECTQPDGTGTTLDLVSSVVRSPYMATMILRCTGCGADQIGTLVLTPTEGDD